MPKVIQMPSLDVLPDGPWREFVEFMFKLYLDARRPTFEEVSKEIERADHQAAASEETIRKIYSGSGIPTKWLTIKAIVLTLCTLSGFDPDSSHLFHGCEDTLMGHADRLWTLALQDPYARSPRSDKRGGTIAQLFGSEVAPSNGDLISGFSGN